jgi:hypothetical protein
MTDENESTPAPLCPACARPLRKIKVPGEEKFGGDRMLRSQWVCPEHGPLPSSGTIRV